MKILIAIIIAALPVAPAFSQSISKFSLNCYRCLDKRGLDCGAPGIDLKGDVTILGNKAQIAVKELYLQNDRVSGILGGFIRGYPDNWGTFDATVDFIGPRGIIFSAKVEDFGNDGKYNGVFTQISISGQGSGSSKFDVITNFSPGLEPGVMAGPGGSPSHQTCEIEF